MKPLKQTVERFIQEEKLIQPDQRLLVAISGGLDSIVLTHLLKDASYYIELAHVNFQLRGAESDRDEQFVRALAQQYRIPLHVKKIDTQAFAEEHKHSIQEAARKIRYEWFADLLEDQGLDLIATAHHADDNVETMMMNLFRGTGLAGIRGILPKQGKIIRPLLSASRDAIHAYATENHLSFVEDSSNASEKYTRNFIRLQILPQIQSIWPEAAENLRQNMLRFRETEALYQEALDRKRKKLVTIKGDDMHVPVEALRYVKPLRTIVFELFGDKGFTAKQTSEIIHLLDATTGSYIDSSTHRILKNRNWLICSPLSKQEWNLLVIEEGQSPIRLNNGQLLIQRKNWSNQITPSTDKHIAQLDSSKVQFPLLIRPWKAGDYFYPLGMSKKKKIARFLIDLKLSKAEKEQVLVIESAGRICWVVGYRIDDRFKIRTSTSSIVALQYTP